MRLFKQLSLSDRYSWILLANQWNFLNKYVNSGSNFSSSKYTEKYWAFNTFGFFNVLNA